MLASSDKIAASIAGLSFEAFSADQDLFDAILFRLIVIGEAAGKTPPDIIATLPDLPWPKIKGMRNAIAHGYFAISLEVVWDTVSTHVPALATALRSLDRTNNQTSQD